MTNERESRFLKMEAAFACMGRPVAQGRQLLVELSLYN